MARRNLGRAATGLPRFWMDVGWWRGRRFAGLPLDALALVQCIVGYGNEHSTDGHVPADPEALAAALGLRASHVKKAIRPLLDRGLLQPDGHELVLVGFEDHNPTRDQVEAYTAERSTLGSKGNHKRWHEARGVIDPTCEWCRTTDHPPDRYSDRPSDSEPIANASHGMGWDGMGQQSSSTTTRDGPVDDDDQAMAIARAELARREAEAGPVGNPDAWLRSVAAGHRRRADNDPDHLDQATARATNAPPAAPSPLDATAAATRAAMDRNAARAAQAPPRDPQTTAAGLTAAKAALSGDS